MKTPVVGTIALLLTLAATVLAVALAHDGADDDRVRSALTEDGDEAGVQIESSSDGSVIVGTDSFSVGGTGVGLTGTSLPGVTVVGSGQASGKPDGAMVALTVGSGSGGIEFGSGGPRIELVDEAELDPIVDSLVKQGVADDDITVSTSASNPYGIFEGGSAAISFRWRDLHALHEMLETIEGVVRDETEYSLQNLQVVYTTEECEKLENEAWEAALDDARDKAERLAQRSGGSLGDIIAVSEAPLATLGYAVSGGCAALEAQGLADLAAQLGGNSSSSVTVQVTVQVTFGLE